MPRKYIKKGQTPEGTARRMRAFRHNGLTGYVAMSRQQMMTIHTSDTASSDAKQTAILIYNLLGDLGEQLKVRID